ncbi:MAG: methyltransferase domain-containing protein [Spirochaetales bacterium]|nr:methyltransferase domain-containing protein [Spirochaetales bacterium]
MEMKPYEKLAEVYEREEWGKFSLRYVEILRNLQSRFHFDVESILDISCGTGLLVSALSGSYTVAGSDISQAMILQARKRYPDIQFHVADMASLRLSDKFDLILSCFDSINYLTGNNHLTRSFRNVHRLLHRPGYFLFDFNTDELYEDKHHGTFERNSGGVRFKQICEYDTVKRLATTVFDFGAGIKEVHTQRAYGYDEIESSLLNNGFEIKYSFDVYKNTPLTDASYKILLLAEKRKISAYKGEDD